MYIKEKMKYHRLVICLVLLAPGATRLAPRLEAKEASGNIYIYIQSRKGNRLLVKEEAISQLNYPLCEKKEPYVD